MADYEEDQIFEQLLNMDLFSPDTDTNTILYVSDKTNLTIDEADAIINKFFSPDNTLRSLSQVGDWDDETEEVRLSLMVYGVVDEDPSIKALISFPSNTRFWMKVIGPDTDSVRGFADEFRTCLPDVPTSLGDDQVVIRNWETSRNGPSSIQKAININHWDEVSDNYPTETRAMLNRLNLWTPETLGNGKVVLLHGAPGTGKSNALLSLIGSWRDWTEVHQIWDPEKFFFDTEYLRTVLGIRQGYIGKRVTKFGPVVGGTPEPVVQPKHSIIILEDCDEYISVDAKEQAGPNLARILNLTDGLLGQSLNFMLIFTTNKSLRDFHPAIKRPGRCLAEVKFDAFNITEAKTWLAEHGNATEGRARPNMTLAELYESLEQQQQLTSAGLKTPVHTGHYL